MGCFYYLSAFLEMNNNTSYKNRSHLIGLLTYQTVFHFLLYLGMYKNFPQFSTSEHYFQLYLDRPPHIFFSVPLLLDASPFGVLAAALASSFPRLLSPLFSQK